MPRPRRLRPPGGLHHVWGHEIAFRPFFGGEEDRRALLDLLRRAAEAHGVRHLGWTLMRNHFHLVIEDPRGALSEAMHLVNSAFARRRRALLGTPGGVFRGRYGSKLIRGGAHLATAVRYVARNPVRHGAVADPAGWAWSSHRSLALGRADPVLDRTRLLELLGGLPAYLDLTAAPCRPFEAPPPGVPVALMADRPALAALRAALPPAEAVQRARAFGYTRAEIATALDLTTWEVRSMS